MKDMYKVQQQAKEIQKELDNIHIKSEVGGIIVTMTGTKKIVSIEISEEAYNKGANNIAENTKKAFEKADKKVEEVSAEKMKGLMSGMGIGGLF